MYSIIRRSNMLYKGSLISIFAVFLIFIYGSPCQADSERKQKYTGRQVDRIAALQSEIDVETQTWGQAGRSAYPAAAAEMAIRSPNGEYLDEELTSLLGSYFGELLERVIVHWSTLLVEEWKYQNYNITLKDKDTQAQTYGYHIYIAFSKPEFYNRDFIALLFHHMVHIQQFEKLGGSLEEFGYRYFIEYKNADQVYENNRIEQEAEFYTNIYISGTREVMRETNP